MPQIAQILETYTSQFFWMLLVFGLLYFVIGRGMVSKVDANIDVRNRKIVDDLAAAERARASADASMETVRLGAVDARAEAQAVSAKAKAQAAQDAENRVAKADADIAAKLAVADAEIATARNNALLSIESVAAEAAQDIVVKLSGAKINAADAAKAVKAVLANG
jgi:F-type H+-transporting ATPase subunit b